MSYSITIENKKGITVDQLLRGLEDDNVKISYLGVDSTASEMKDHITLYKEFESTRGVTIRTTDEEHDVIINVLATEADYILARDVAKTLAKLSDAGIQPEWEESAIDIESFDTKYSMDWIEDIKGKSAFTFKFVVESKNETIQIPCCIRPFFFGPNVIAEINTEDENEFYKSLCQKIKKIQYLDKGKIRIPEVGQFEGDDATLILFNEAECQFVPKVDFVYINSDQVYKIPHEDFINSKVLNFERLDESQFMVENIDSIVFKALKKEFEGFVQRLPKKKKWWKFW